MDPATTARLTALAEAWETYAEMPGFALKLECAKELRQVIEAMQEERRRQVIENGAIK